MRTTIAVLALALTLAPGTARADDDHVVRSTQVASRMAAAAAAGQGDRALLERVLTTSAARSAAASLGSDVDRLRTGLAGLDDAEARDLAARALALGVDPAAGHDWDTNDILVVFLVFAIVILVLDAV